ncbi:MAG: serine/threonine protein kinase [Phycisphaerae bacterium]|nr:serine/threonine protein kinase [Phycisphaerae bacterium]
MSSSRARLRIQGYEVLEYLGSGARSTIWRLRDNKTGRFCALKRIVRQTGDDNRYFGQALNEFNVAANFDHPAIRKYHRVRKLRSFVKLREMRLFMELCPGSSCQSERPTDVVRTAKIFLAVAEALVHIHSRWFVHADIKPNNIIAADDGTVKIIDFGQSCPIGTVKERIQGTPDFIAPEQVYRRPLDGRTDVFNFGASLYWTLTGQAIPTTLPKKTSNVPMISDLRAKPPEELNDKVPTPLSRLVMDCIEPDPIRRPQSAKDVFVRLDLITHALNRKNHAPEQ